MLETTRRDLFELAAGYAEESVIITSPDLDAPGPEILYVNTAFTRMTGYSAAELMGRSPRLLQGPATDRATLDSLKAQLLSGADFIARTTNYRRDGKPFELEWIITRLGDSDGNTTHYVAVQRDITGTERAAEGLRQADRELRELGEAMVHTVRRLEQVEQQMARAERMNALGRMAQGVTHDLRNSLGPAAWLLDSVLAEDDLEGTTRERIAAARANLQFGLDLTGRLDGFASAGKSTETTTTIDAATLVDEVLDLTRPQVSVADKPINVTSTVDDDIELTVSPVEFRQVLVNLVLNAVDATADGGDVRISVTQEADGQVAIAVSDTGNGMDGETAAHCFEPFFTTRDEGTGLGLSISQQVIEQHGGSIEVTSTPGDGSTFLIRLPATPVTADTSEADRKET